MRKVKSKNEELKYEPVKQNEVGLAYEAGYLAGRLENVQRELGENVLVPYLHQLQQNER